jgi:CheY-like chemotaxis protein
VDGAIKILIVDDSKAARELLCATLEAIAST